jgi:hypothetical protein
MNEKDMSRLEMDAAAMAILIGIAKRINAQIPVSRTRERNGERGLNPKVAR